MQIKSHIKHAFTYLIIGGIIVKAYEKRVSFVQTNPKKPLNVDPNATSPSNKKKS
jgi:hypothetical protein